MRRLLLILASLARAYPGDVSQIRPAITIRLVNLAGIAETTVQSVEKQAAYVLGIAGVDVKWLECPAGPAVADGLDECSRGMGATDFWVTLLNWRPPNHPEDELGFTSLGSTTGVAKSAGVYYPLALSLTRSNRIGLDEILGIAAVHEIGHLLLGASHSHSGIMAGRWSEPEFKLARMGSLLFTSDQARELRSEILRRATASTRMPSRSFNVR